MSNLDPALDSGQQRPDTSRPNHAAVFTAPGEQYRPDAARNGSSYGSSAQQTPYYHYTSSIQHTNAQESASASSAQATPDGHSFLSPVPQQPFEQTDEQAAQEEAKRQRACEACRGLKVRCDQDLSQPDVPCKRCAKAGRACVITQPSRKRQKKADSRVAELEKKLDALTAVLNNRHGVGLPEMPPPPPPEAPIAAVGHQQSQPWQASPATQAASEPPLKRRRTDQPPSEWDARFAQLQLVSRNPDAKSYLHPDFLPSRISSLIPPAQGAQLFQRYAEKMTKQLPLVVFPTGTSAEQVSRDKPILYLAIISAASFGQTPPSTTAQLQDECMAAIGDLCVRRGAKSLELIQAMQVVALFYKPPSKAEHTNFYQLIHMAAVMALDIGLGRRYNNRKQLHPIGRQEIAFSARALHGQNSDLIEARRAWLGCYYLCATASMVLRRPNLVRWTEYMKECIEVLESSPEAAASDRLLCQHVKIQHICEDIGQQFLMDDSTAQVSINDPKVTYALNVLENQLHSWKMQIPAEVQHPSLTFFEHVTNLYLHEIALHSNHNIEDFRLPFTEESLKNVDTTLESLSPNKVVAIEACLKAAHGILSTILTYDAEEMLSMPMLVFFVRCIYALVILIKMHVAITLPQSELGKIIKPEDLKIEFYMHGLLKLFRSMGDVGEAKPEKILRIMSVLSEWFTFHKETVSKQQTGGGQHAYPSRGQQFDQTPLQMLSQVASGQSQRIKSDGISADWTVDNPSAVKYGSHSKASQAAGAFPSQQQNTNGMAAMDPGLMSMLDMLGGGQDYGWGSGFEQAMDMTMGSLGDLQGGGLDNWYMGENNGSYTDGSAAQGQPAGASGNWSGL